MRCFRYAHCFLKFFYYNLFSFKSYFCWIYSWIYFIKENKPQNYFVIEYESSAQFSLADHRVGLRRLIYICSRQLRFVSEKGLLRMQNFPFIFKILYPSFTTNLFSPPRLSPPSTFSRSRKPSLIRPQVLIRNLRRNLILHSSK